MAQTASDMQLALDLETALNGLIKMNKALSFYPLDHPALAAVSAEACVAFQPLLDRHDTHPYHVTAKGFSINNISLGSANKSLQELALKLVERRVRHLLFLPELSQQDLLTFAEELNQPVEECLRRGGLQGCLEKRRVSTIWINETNLQAILDKHPAVEEDAELPSDGPQPPAEATEERSEQLEPEADAPLPEGANLLQQVRELIEQLKDPQDDDNYLALLAGLEPLIPAFFEKTGLPGCLALLGLLQNHRQDVERSSLQQEHAAQCLERLLTRDVKKRLVDAVANENLKSSQQRALARLLVNLKQQLAPALLKRLFGEKNAMTRRRYTALLARMGAEIFPLIEDSLDDERWYVIRSLVNILGESRLPGALPLLEKALPYPHIKVRRAIIRALGTIGGEQVIPLLLRLSKVSHQELQQAAIAALGALGNPEAVPALAEIVTRPDPLGKDTAIKLEAMRALVAIKSPRGIIPLLKMARKSNLFRRARLEKLRAEAILGLGQIGNHHLLPLLKRLKCQRRGPVNRALQRTTAQLHRQTDAT